jgi:DnaJ-class molecular chaperone
MDTKPSFKDYYYILGVSTEAGSEEIQAAYHELYDKYGPHVTMAGQDPEMLLKTFKDISEAYETLMDPAKRKEYDQKNQHLFQKGDVRALWSKLTGLAGGNKQDKLKSKTQTAAAPDTEMEIEVTLKEAIKGTRKQIRLDEPKPCESCVGLKPVQRLQCPSCRGLGYTMVERTEDIDLPGGLYEKVVVRKTELGKYDMHAQRRGDLVLNIKLRAHNFLQVQDRDLTCTVPITIYEAVLGAEIEIPTASGKVIMKVQPRTHNGRVYRLKGLGLAGADQLVTVEVTTPQQLGDEELRMFQRLQNMSKDPNPRDSLDSKTS